MSPGPLLQNLPHPALTALDAQVTRILALIQAGQTNAALAQALGLTRQFPSQAQGYALCAHLLSLHQDSDLALPYWERAIEQDPLETSWLPQAARTALDAKRRDLAQTWLKGLEKQYIRPPGPGILDLAVELGLDLRGAVGVHNRAVLGWVRLEPGQHPALHAFGPDQVRMRLSPPARGTENRIRRLTIPLDLRAVLILHILDPRGKHLPGSPVYCEPPALLARHFHKAGKRNRKSRPASPGRQQQSKSPPGPEVTVIVPVYGDRQATLHCLQALEATRPQCKTRFSIMAVWDAGPDEQLLAALQKLAGQKRLTLLMNKWNMGFVNSVNRAMGQCSGSDLVLLNADALVQGNWLDRLSRHALRADTVGTVTPFSNYGELLSYPHPLTPGTITSLEQIKRIDRAAQTLNIQDPSLIPEFPVGVGFCLYIRAPLLERIGGLDSAGIHRGYGEEVDFCLRAKARGFENRVAPDVFVGHLGGRSFGPEKRRLALQNNQVLEARYPEYRSRYRSFLQQDPLRQYREGISISLIQEISGPLWIMDQPHAEQPAWQVIQNHLEQEKAPWARILVRVRGMQLQLTIQVQTRDLPMADIHLRLPRDHSLLHRILRGLAPQEINAFGPGPGTQQLMASLPGEVHLCLTGLPRQEREAWRNHRGPGLESLSGYASITCFDSSLTEWLQKGHAQVCCPDSGPGRKFSDLPVFDFQEDRPGHSNLGLLACGLNTPSAWQKLVLLARDCLKRDIQCAALGGEAWRPYFPPPGVDPAPLALADSPEIWQTIGIQDLLILDDDPAYAPQWLNWAWERGMAVSTW